MKKTTRLLALLLVIVLAVSCLSGCAGNKEKANSDGPKETPAAESEKQPEEIKRTPEEILLSAIGKQSAERKKTVEEHMEKLKGLEEADPFVKSMLEGGSANLIASIPVDLGGFQMPVNADLKAFFNGKGATVKAVLGLLGQDLFNLRADLDENHLALTEPSILGNKAYGLSFENLTERYEKSVFGPEGKYNLGLDLSALNADGAADVLTTLKDADFEAVIRELVDGISECSEQIERMAADNGTVTAEETTVEADGETVSVTAIRVSRDEEQTKAYLEEIIAAVKANEKIKKTYDALVEFGTKLGGESFAEELQKLWDGSIGETDGTKVDAVYYVAADDEMVGTDVTAVSEKMTADISCIGKNTKAHIVSTDEEAPADITFSMGEESVNALVKVTSDGEEQTLTFTADKTGKFALNGPEGTVSASGRLDTEKGTFTLSVSAQDTVIKADAAANKDTGAFTLTADVNGTAIALDAVTVEEEGKKTVTFGTLKIGDTELDLSGVSLVLLEKDEMPAPLDYSDILDLSEEDADALLGQISSIGDTFNELAYIFMGDDAA